MKRITINRVKEFLEEHEAEVIVILAKDDEGGQCVATFGKSNSSSEYAARIGNGIKKAIGWEQSQCHAKPLKRVCGNCDYYKPDYGVFCINGWSGDGSNGHCHYDRGVLGVDHERIACHNFKGNNWE